MKIKTSEVKFRKELYPRIEHSQSKVQEYAECLELLPPIEINQNNELIDGFHRLYAFQTKGAEEIEARVTHTENDAELLMLAIERNASHGLQLSLKEKRKYAVAIYGGTTPEQRGEIKPKLAATLKVSDSTLANWIADIDSATIQIRNETILRMHLQCYTDEEIADAVGMTRGGIRKVCIQILNLEAVCKLHENGKDMEKGQVLTPEDVSRWRFEDLEFDKPIYNVWSFAKKTNETEHFGNTEQRITENLLWLYTQPLDIVVDPFGGGGATLDVCIKRGRRCWISDRKPKPCLEGKLRTLDVCESLPPLNKRWSDVSLVYLDPPYWRQAEGQYSEDPQDLANMPLETFTGSLSGVITGFSKTVKPGSIIALIIQPTQWRSEPKGHFTDHVFDIIHAVGNKRVEVENRISCPYSTQQCTPQMVNWAKENKKPLVLSRELIIWRVQ